MVWVLAHNVVHKWHKVQRSVLPAAKTLIHQLLILHHSKIRAENVTIVESHSLARIHTIIDADIVNAIFVLSTGCQRAISARAILFAETFRQLRCHTIPQRADITLLLDHRGEPAVSQLTFQNRGGTWPY